MDEFASAGYLVVGIDYFHGDSVEKHDNDADFDFWAWVYKYVSIADEGVRPWIGAVKELYDGQDTKFACVGYCFGGPYVCRELATDGSCSVGAFAHPGLLKQRDFEQLESPLFMSSPVVDPLFPKEMRTTASEILRSRKIKFHVQEFADVNHGYALRCNLDNPYERWVKEHCHRAMVDWFGFWLSAPASSDSQRDD